MRAGGSCSACAVTTARYPSVLPRETHQLARPVAPASEDTDHSRPAAMAAETEKVEPADSEQDEEEDVYEVERIIDMRVEEVTL